MPYLLGIDEAGYGPNLGPFVMSLVAVRVPTGVTDLWQALAPVVRRADEPADGRLIIDDSKRIFSPGGGLAELERSLYGTLWPGRPAGFTLEEHLADATLTSLSHLTSEPWYQPGMTLPREPLVNPLAEQLSQACRLADIEFCQAYSVIVFPRHFNTLVRARDSKAAVPAWAVKRLLSEWRPPQPARESSSVRDPRATIIIDKLGGRNHYHALVQGIFPDQYVYSLKEGAAESTYRVGTAEHATQLTYMPEADRLHLPVALASMLSKYLREVCMDMFNAFWRQYLPELRPTAGYPLDARRFWNDIREVRERLGMEDDVLWRCR
jgi:ribonuclease HII